MNIFRNDTDYLIGSKPNMGKETPFLENDLTTDPDRYKRISNLVRKIQILGYGELQMLLPKLLIKDLKNYEKKVGLKK
jgi:hypothetical protein